MLKLDDYYHFKVGSKKDWFLVLWIELSFDPFHHHNYNHNLNGFKIVHYDELSGQDDDLLGDRMVMSDDVNRNAYVNEDRVMLYYVEVEADDNQTGNRIQTSYWIQWSWDIVSYDDHQTLWWYPLFGGAGLEILEHESNHQQEIPTDMQEMMSYHCTGSIDVEVLDAVWIHDTLQQTWAPLSSQNNRITGVTIIGQKEDRNIRWWCNHNKQTINNHAWQMISRQEERVTNREVKGCFMSHMTHDTWQCICLPSDL